MSSDEVPKWLRELTLSDAETESFKSALERADNSMDKVVFRRFFVVQDDETTADIVDIGRGDSVFLRVSIDKTTVPESSGNQPSGYDPAKDYVTDTDYEAHHGG